MSDRAPRRVVPLVAVVAALGACAGARLREPSTPTSISTASADVDLVSVSRGGGNGIWVALPDKLGASVGVTVRVRWRARAAGTSIVWAFLAPPQAAPCTAGASLELLQIDGQTRWDRPAGLGAQHEIALSFPRDQHLESGALALDVAVAGARGPECVRVALGTGLLGLVPADVAPAGAQGIRFRSTRVREGGSGDLSVEIRGLEDVDEEQALVVEGRVVAPTPAGIVGAALARPETKPCAQRDEVADAIAVDGVAQWARPVSMSGDQRLTLSFPLTLGLGRRLEGPLAIDVATDRGGVPGCVRVPIQGDDDAATWVPTSPWMAGLRLELWHFDGYERHPWAIGARGGHWLGPVIAGVEGTLSLSRVTAAAVATLPVAWWLSLEGAYAGRWDFSEAGPPGRVIRHGPRVGLSFDTARIPRVERVHVGGLGVDVSRWWASGGQAASTEVILRVVGWVSPSVF
jgi:hypothetical protein